MDMERVWRREARDVVREAQQWRIAEAARLPTAAPDHSARLAEISRAELCRVNDRVVDALSRADLTLARFIAGEWHQRTAIHRMPDSMESGEGIDHIAQRLASAWMISGYRPEPEDVLLAYPHLSDADLHRAGRMRAVGSWAEWALMQPAGEAGIGHTRGGLMGWARRMRWLLEIPELLRIVTPTAVHPRQSRVATMLTHPDVLQDLARAVNDADMSHQWALYGNRYLALTIAGRVQGEWATAHSSLDLGAGARARAETYLRDIAGITLPGRLRADVALADMRGGEGFCIPVESPLDLDVFLSACAACDHRHAAFALNPTTDALRLECPDCGQLALACIPLHRAPGQPLPERYLMSERFYAALDGEWGPDCPEDLAGPLMSLDPADYLPHRGILGGEADLTTALFA